MVTIKLDPQGETKQITENSEFKEKLEQSDSGVLLSNADKKPYTGTIKTYKEDGDLFAQYNYVDGKQEGKQSTFYANGKIKDEVHLKNGVYDGEYMQYYENGNLQSVAVFKFGKQIGLTSYFESGIKNITTIYNDRGIKKEEKIFNESGILSNIKTFDNKNIWVTNYHENKKIESKGKVYNTSILDEYKKDFWVYYYKNGNKKKEGNWGKGGRHGDANVQVGIWNYYNEEGALSETKDFDRF